MDIEVRQHCSWGIQVGGRIVIPSDNHCFAVLEGIESSDEIVVELFGGSRRIGSVKNVTGDDQQIYFSFLDLS